jgi:hypothetical protein
MYLLSSLQDRLASLSLLLRDLLLLQCEKLLMLLLLLLLLLRI